jgi:nitroreductase
MDFHDVVSTAWTNRHFTTDPVPDEVLARAFDAARFGPQGGNRQPVRFIVVRDQSKRTQLKDWYLAMEGLPRRGRTRWSSHRR